jgi:hypothetical protein
MDRYERMADCQIAAQAKLAKRTGGFWQFFKQIALGKLTAWRGKPPVDKPKERKAA